MAHIDLNSDLGESVAGIPVTRDEEILPQISSANVACGFHAGAPRLIKRTLTSAAATGTTVGAHPGYKDPEGFGRRFIDYDPADLADEVLYQLGALDALARDAGTKLSYVKPHGAMYNTIVHHEAQAKAVIAGIRAFDADLPILLLPGGVAVDVARAAGSPVVLEAFADRNYLPDGTLISRREANAVVTDPEAVAARVLRLATEGTMIAVDGTELHLDAASVCLHGDSPGSIDLSRAIRARLDEAGVEVRPFA